MNHENNRNEVHIISNYILHNLIGSGSYGKVYKVQEKETGTIYAAKIISKDFNDNSIEFTRSIIREINIISKLNHPSIIKFISYSPVNFKRKPKPIIITEYASNGTLEEFLDSQKINNTILNDTRKLIIIYGIASALSYLHSHDIIHRDLKPANILLDDFLFPKIADFGLSRINDQNDDKLNFKSTIGVIKGTPKYISPEIWEKCEYSKASDVYAFGIIVYEIMMNEKAFENFHFFEILIKIKDKYRPPFNNPIPLSYKKLIKDCWSQNPIKRPTFDDILEKLRNDHGFITESVNENDYFNYINYIKDQNISFDFSKKTILINNQMNSFSSSYNYHSQKQQIIYNLKYYPFKEFQKLSNECKNLVIDAEDDPEKQFIVGLSLFEGREYFPINIQLGIKYLMKSIKNNNKKSLIYYCKQLIKGKYIPKNHKKAKKLIQKYITNDDGLFNLLYGIMYNKKGKFQKAQFYFEKSMNEGNGESMYEYAKMLLKENNFFVDKENSEKYLQKSIENSCIKAMHKYGIILINSNDLDKKERGISLIKKAAEKNYTKSLYYCSTLYKKDDEDNTKSIDYLRRAAYKGHIESMYNYGLYLLNNKYDDNQMNEISYLFKNASDRGHINSMYYYGKLIYKDLQSSTQKASQIIKISGDNGNDDAMTEYGQMLFNGDGVDVNKEEAARYFKLAIEKGNTKAMVQYAYMLQYGQGIKEDKIEAIKYYKMAIEKGNDDAMYNYACMLKNGDGISINYEKAIEYYKMAIEKGNDDAMYNYACMLKNGDGISINYEEAIEYFRMAIEKGNDNAMVKYAYFLQYGICVPLNIEEAIKYYKMAIEKGNTDAMIEYGEILAKGKGVPVNKELASYYYKMAGDKGDVFAMNEYGEMLEKGDGITPDFNEAKRYYKMAKTKGDTLGTVRYFNLSFKSNNTIMILRKYALYFYTIQFFHCLYKWKKNDSRFWFLCMISYIFLIIEEIWARLFNRVSDVSVRHK